MEDGSRYRAYRYSRFIRIAHVLVAATLGYVSGRFAILSVDLLRDEGLREEPAVLLTVVGPSLLALVVALIRLNWDPDLVLAREGIRVQVFTFWNVLVPWRDVLEIRKCYIPWSRLSLILVEGLTPIHRLFGLLYGLTARAAIPVERGLPGYEELTAEVEQQLMQRGRAKL